MTNATRTTQGIRIVIAALTVAILGATSAAAQMSVSPIDFKLDPAGPRVGAFSVTNESKDPQQLVFYANDWDRSETGENRFFPLGTLPMSCRSRIQLFPQSVRLPPGGNTSIRVSLIPGDTTRAACWTIVFAQTAPSVAGKGSEVAFVTRIGVKVYVTPGNATIDAAIDSMAVAPHHQEAGEPAADSATKQDVLVLFHNTGGAPVIAKGSADFRTLDNKSMAKVAIDDTPVLPGALRGIRVQVPATLAKGQYIALVVLSFGGGDDVAGQVGVDVP